MQDDELYDFDYESFKKTREYKPMTNQKRAAQFMPFAALRGYEEAIEETLRQTEPRREPDEDRVRMINEGLNELLENIGESPVIQVEYFEPDKTKPGGKYLRHTGAVRTVDMYAKEIVFEDKKRVKIAELYDIKVK